MNNLEIKGQFDHTGQSIMLENTGENKLPWQIESYDGSEQYRSQDSMTMYQDHISYNDQMPQQMHQVP